MEMFLYELGADEPARRRGVGSARERRGDTWAVRRGGNGGPKPSTYSRPSWMSGRARES